MLVAQLNADWRVVDDGTQWRLMRRDSERGWVTGNRGGILHNLLNYIRTHVKDIDPAALAIVQALPGDYRLVLQARGQYRPPPPRSRCVSTEPKVSRPRRACSVVVLKAPESLPAPVAAAVAVAVLVAAEAPAPPQRLAYIRPTPPAYVRRLAAAFIAWRSAIAASSARELVDA